MRDVAAAMRRLRVERHERIDAEQQVDAVVERDRCVQRLVERAVDVVLAVDLDRRKQSGQRARRLDRARDGHVVVTGRAERRPRSPVSRFVATRKSSRRKLAEIVRATGRREQVASGSASIARLSNRPVGIARASVANDSITPRCSGSRRYCSDARAARRGNDGRRRPNSRNAGRRNSSGLQRGVLAVVDEQPVHLRRRDAVRQRRGDEAAGRHADVDVERVAIEMPSIESASASSAPTS